MSAIRDKLTELDAAGVDVDSIPDHLTISELIRYPVEWFKKYCGQKVS